MLETVIQGLKEGFSQRAEGLQSLYIMVFGQPFHEQQGCTQCRQDAYNKLKNWVHQQQKTALMGNYKFIKKGQRVVMQRPYNITIDESNLTDANAQLLINNNRGHLIELVPGKEAPNVTPETKPVATSSTSAPAKTVGGNSAPVKVKSATVAPGSKPQRGLPSTTQKSKAQN